MYIFLLNGTPVQLILAEELKHVLKLADADCVLAVREIAGGTYKFSIRDKAEVERFSHWKEVYFIPQQRHMNFFQYVANFREYIRYADRLVRQHGPVQGIFLGNYGNEPMRHVATRYARRGVPIYFLDEGIGTLHLYQSRESGTSLTRNKTSLAHRVREGVREFFKSRVLGLQGGEVPLPVNFFTEYPLASTSRTTIVPNDFALTRQKLHEWKRDDRVYYIGTAYIYFGHLKREDYFSFFEFIVKYYQGRKIVYVPHPREDRQEVRDLADRYGMEVLDIDLAIELYIMQERILPQAIGGFTSTSLSRIYKMLGGHVPITSFRMPYSRLIRRKEVVDNIYAYFSRELASDSFTVVDIND